MIIDRYLGKEITATFIGVVTVLLLIFIGAQMVSLLAQVNAGSIPLNTVMLLLGLKSVGNMVFLLPLSLYLAVLLAFGRLYRDNEMVVLSACGIGQTRILRAVMGITVFFALLVGVIALLMAPWAEDQVRRMSSAGDSASGLESLTAGRFQEAVGGKGVIYVEQVNPEANVLGNIFLQHRTETHSSVITARAGFYQEDPATQGRYLILEDGYRYEGEPGEDNYAIIRFAKHAVLIDEKGEQESGRRPKEVPTLQLWKSENAQHLAELQWRISAILLSIILAILALPLSRTSPRQGRYGRLGVALVLYIIYTNLLNIARVKVERGELNPDVGLWAVHLAFILVAIVIYSRPQWLNRLLGK